MIASPAFCFDLDGTITRLEVLPVIAAELGLAEEIGLLTQMTIRGQIPFEMSFRLRCRLLASIPVATVAEIVDSIPLDLAIVDFIADHREHSYVVTGNLDVWVNRLIARLGCRAFTSTAEVAPDGRLGSLTSVLSKQTPIRTLRTDYERVVCVGEGFNDLPMFEASDIGIAYAGVHPPAREVIDAASYVVAQGPALCRLLNTL